MDLSNIRLVATDMDGTLLNTRGQVSDHFFQIFKELKSQGIIFVAASGRQYYSIIDKLHPIQNEIYVIAENGALMMHKGKELATVAIQREMYLKLLERARLLNDSQIILCGRKKGYIEDYGEAFIEMFKEYYSKYEIVDDLTKITDDQYLKIAICNQKGSEAYLYPAFKDLETDLKVKISGDIWLDLSHANANKGYALQMLQKQLGISKDETLVFGDYNNDIEMMDSASYSFAMQNAHPNLKAVAKYTTKSNNEGGVEHILSQLINPKTL